MSRLYDNWEKLVGAVLRSEKDRQLAYCESFSTSTRCSSDLGSPFSLDLRLRDGCIPADSSAATEAFTYEFESRKQIEEDIMATLRGEHVKMMGICGMGCEDQDKDKRKKSSDQGVIKMLQGMKATLLLLNNLEHDNAKERPITSSAIDADKQSDLLDDDEEDEEEEEESIAEQKKSEGDNLPGDYKEEEKSLEDSTEPVKGRPVAKTTKPRRRDSNRSSKQGGATSAALKKSGLFMGKADNEDDTTANDDVEKEDPNFRQDSEVEQNTDLPAENNEEKTLEDSAAAIALKGRSNTKSRKLDSNRSAQPGGAATLNDAVKCGVFMEKAIMEKDDADDLYEGRDEEDNVSGQVTRSVEEEENVSTNSVSLQKRNEGRKKTKKNVSNRSANAQLQQAKPKRPSVNMASAAQKKMVKPLVNDLTKSGDDKSEGQEAVPDDGGDGGAADIEDEQSLLLEGGQALGGIIDSLEGLMDPLGLSGLGLENWNEAKRLVVEISGLLQQFMKNNKGRRRQTDTAKSIYVASDFMEQQPDIDDDDDDDGELQSLPQEKEPETDERSAEEKATENYGSLLKGKNVLKRPPNKHTKTVRHDLDHSAEDAAMKSDESEEPGEVTGEGSMEENESPQPEFEAEEKSPVKDEEANNEPENTMSNVFSTPVSKTMKPGKRGPNRLAQAPLQRARAEKKPMSSIADVVKSSGRSKVSRNNGIRGVRPTIVVPSWDRGACVPRLQSRFFADKVGNEEVGRNRSEKEKDMRIQIVPREEICTLWESCSFTSNDDDSSSSVTEPILSMSSNERYGRVIHDWQKGELLGRGTFGSVYEGIADGGFFFAVKEVSLLDQGVEGKQCIIQLEQEIALLSQFEHENIVRYYGTEKDATHLYIFLELVTQGSLLRLYQKYDLRVPQVSGYTRQILHGLKYLHDRNVIHRDIKCANILVHTNGLVKLADFGLAKAAKLNDVKSCKGTAFWMAPEVVRSKGYGLAADIWSLGCTVLEMLTRSFPFSGLEHMTALYKIGQGERPFVPDTLSSDAQDFILQCLQVNPSLRPTAAQLLDHPFVKRPLPSSSGLASAHSFGWQF